MSKADSDCQIQSEVFHTGSACRILAFGADLWLILFSQCYNGNALCVWSPILKIWFCKLILVTCGSHTSFRLLNRPFTVLNKTAQKLDGCVDICISRYSCWETLYSKHCQSSVLINFNISFVGYSTYTCVPINKAVFICPALFFNALPSHTFPLWPVSAVLHKQIHYTVVNINVGRSSKQVTLTCSPIFPLIPLATHITTAYDMERHWLAWLSLTIIFPS